MSEPLISICIPSYKKPLYVVRCLQSIIKQDYKFVEVIISDDSPDEDIKQAIQPFWEILDLKYFHNKPALGTPKNWNAAMDRASGDLLLLLHQDDWLEADNALSQFVHAISPGEVDFVFCQNTAIDENGNKIILQSIPRLLKDMEEKPNQLLLAQVIGPPSNTMLKRRVDLRYDEQFIWLVDVDYYSRILKAGYKYRYIDKHLVSIGLHPDQATEFVQKNKDILFKENIWFGKKIGDQAFRDIKLYDYYWRLLRNHHIRNIGDFLVNNVGVNEIPNVIKQMLSFQKKIPLSVLKLGVLSKPFMALSYAIWRLKTG
jgi:glycosyltransferase involved in cell wall biosynthesis